MNVDDLSIVIEKYNKDYDKIIKTIMSSKIESHFTVCRKMTYLFYTKWSNGIFLGFAKSAFTQLNNLINEQEKRT